MTSATSSVTPSDEALPRSEYLTGLAAAGSTGGSVGFTHEVVPGLDGTIVRATEPAQPEGATP